MGELTACASMPAMMLKIASALALMAVMATCAPETESEVLMAITALKKKGATRADCAELAKRTCKEVEAEVTNNQRVMDKLKDGSQCVSLGQREVTKATTHYKTTLTRLKSAKVAVFKAKTKKLHFVDRKYKDMVPGNCNWVFGSRAYLSAHTTLKRTTKIKITLDGALTEAKRVMHVAIASARRQVKHCHCATKKLRDRLWKTVGNAKLIKKQNRAHTKCKMMSCVLAGTNIRAAKCQGSLPTLRNKRLISATERVSGCASGITKLSTRKQVRRRV